MLNDVEIRELIDCGVLQGAHAENIGSISCDLVTDKICDDDGSHTVYTLEPLQSVFIEPVESVRLTNRLSARIGIKNSRLRQGLQVDAPVYFPGHNTKLFFRVTNLSNKDIMLKRGDSVAQVFFDQCDEVEHPYEGAFVDEFDFKGLAAYKDIYANQMHEVAEKYDDLKSLEKRVYGNVLTLLAIFVGIFSIVNTNIGLIGNKPDTEAIIVFSLVVVGSISALVSLLLAILHEDGKSRMFVTIAIAIVCFVAAVLLA